MTRPLRYRADLDRGIGQHKFYERDRLRLDDVTGILCFIGLIVFLLWLIGEAA